jgi:Flp pilus assembly protein TadB
LLFVTAARYKRTFYGLQRHQQQQQQQQQQQRRQRRQNVNVKSVANINMSKTAAALCGGDMPSPGLRNYCASFLVVAVSVSVSVSVLLVTPLVIMAAEPVTF